MISIDLEKNDDACVVAEKSKNLHNVKKNFNFKKKLILQVRRHRLLYDNKNKLFSNVAKKELVWQQIAKELKINVDDCKDTWIELRYDYQRYARRLHNYLVNGRKENRKRPAMYLESELMFLWRFIENRKTCSLAFEIMENIAQPEPQPEPQPVHQAEPQLVHQPEPQPVHQPQPQTVHQPQPQTVHKPEPQTVHQPEPQQVHQPEPQPVHQTEPQPVHQPEPQLVHQPEPKPVHQPQPQTVHEPQPQTVHKPEPQTCHQSVHQTELQPVHQPEPQPVHQPEPQTVHQPEPQPVHQSQPQTVHQPKPQPVHQPNLQPVHQAEPQPVHQPTPQPKPQPVSQPNLQPVHQPEPQPKPQPVPQPNLQPEPQTETEIQQTETTEVNIIVNTIEEEMVKEVKRSKQNRAATANKKTIDDDLIIVESPVEVIVIDEDDDNSKTEKQFKVSHSMKLLIAHIKTYPELYDSEHLAFKDYTRKSYIWNAIAGNLSDKATKLMKCWIVMQTRYEWELRQGNQQNENTAIPPTELQVQLEFLKKFILANPNTVYKQSYYLKTSWFDPIDYFKDIYNLIVRMKKMSDIVNITDSLIKTPEKSKQYLTLWTDIANLKGCSAGQCETTWLIMRHFYWELMFMRQQNYQLTDKWYFETIIGELYAISKAAQTSKQQELQVLKQSKQMKKGTKRAAQTSATSLGAPSKSREATPIAMSPTIINNLQSVPVSISTQTTQSATVQSNSFPKITAAISLAPQALNTGSLQIKPIPGPPNLSPAPHTHNIYNSMTATALPPSTVRPAMVSTQIPMPAMVPTQIPMPTMVPTQIPMPTMVPTQIPMPYNLPTQTKVTSMPLPAPTWGSLAPTTPQPMIRTTPQLMVRSKAVIRPAPPVMPAKLQIRPLANPAMTTVSTNANIPTMTANLQAPTTLGSSNNTSFSYVPSATPGTSISSFKLTVPFSNTASTNCAVPVNATPITTANSSQLPKITSAISLLNANEILIELIASQSGNQLVVHGPPLSAKYQLNMPTVAKFIREVLAIPLLHNKHSNQPNIINNYWEHIGRKFNLPVHICRACWNFLLENFNHFPQIAPLKDLMRPFQTSLTVWQESTSLFQKFDEHCVSNGWLQHMKRLPEVVECIGGYPVLYQDVYKANSNKKLSDMEALCAWRTISLRFPKIPNIQEIWGSIKACFCQYMTDLEFGIDNKWPINWWRALARLKFLVEARYTANEPFYYIISNKMVEEIEKCAMLEMKNRYKNDKSLTNAENEKTKTQQEEGPTTSNDLMASWMASSDGTGKKEVELGALVTAIQKHPVIYGKADNVVKFEAWKKVANELRMELSDCLLAFKHATQMYFAYKKHDPVSRCRINEKYYKKFDEIVRNLESSKSSTNRCKLNIRTPFELNRSVDTDSSSNGSNDADLVFPERYISDISMSNSPSILVVKNWVYAIGNLVHFGDKHILKLNAILNKYLPNVKGWPSLNMESLN